MSDADRAAAGAGSYGPMARDVGSEFGRELLHGPWSDIERLSEGKVTASDLVLPESGRTRDPYFDLHRSVQATDAALTAVRTLEYSGRAADAQRMREALDPLLKNAEAALRDAVAQYHARPSKDPAVRQQIEDALDRDFALLERARKQFAVEQVARAVVSHDPALWRSAVNYVDANGLELSDDEVSKAVERQRAALLPAPQREAALHAISGR